MAFGEGWGARTWKVWEGGFAAGEGCAGWAGDLGDGGEVAETAAGGGEVAETAAGGGLAEEGDGHFELIGMTILEHSC